MRELTCVECPMGCKITVKTVDGKYEFSGYSCPRGTVKLVGGGVLPVKTDKPISKKDMFKVMEVINSLTATAPVKTGDVIKSDVYGANIISARTIK